LFSLDEYFYTDVSECQRHDYERGQTTLNRITDEIFRHGGSLKQKKPTLVSQAIQEIQSNGRSCFVESTTDASQRCLMVEKRAANEGNQLGVTKTI